MKYVDPISWIFLFNVWCLCQRQFLYPAIAQYRYSPNPSYKSGQTCAIFRLSMVSGSPLVLLSLRTSELDQWIGPDDATKILRHAESCDLDLSRQTSRDTGNTPR
ncbi:hypothetical protein TW71_024750 (plasmid) [Vibrio coralliilyticus]|uniref:hypothetical protein n=1 Tax=Vibrio coralliilyticus TaxID=190893 RepID=UPI0012D3F4C8|nr:hypothetical protein [Vibrio coralliilyticus]QOU33194.1 hypothetical protein TW71_024750 [Vibrio coralliilyticus]